VTCESCFKLMGNSEDRVLLAISRAVFFTIGVLEKSPLQTGRVKEEGTFISASRVLTDGGSLEMITTK